MLGLPVHDAAQQRAQHAAREGHERTEPQQIAQQARDKGDGHAVPRAEQNSAQDVHHMLHRRTLAAEHRKRKQASHNGDGAQQGGNGKLLNICLFHGSLSPLDFQRNGTQMTDCGNSVASL